MLFHVRMDVHIPLDMPPTKQMKLRLLKKPIRKTYNVKVNGVTSGELQASIQTSVFLM